MNKHLKKTLSIAGGIIFIIFLAFLPTILLQGTVKSFNLAVKIKKDVTQKNTRQPPIATIEPIEKVGLFHFLAGTKTYYLKTDDENFDFTQKTSSSKTYLRPQEQVLNDAKNATANIISLVDSNSTTANDYNLEIAKAAKQNNFRVVMVYGSCLDLATLKKILPYTDAVLIKFGGQTEDYCPEGKTTSSLLSLQEKIKAVKTTGKHWEVADKIYSSSNATIETNSFLNAVISSGGIDSEIHFYTDENEATTSAIAAREQSLCGGLKYTYTSGFDYQQGESTYCADGSFALSRQSNYLLQNNLIDGKCADGTTIPGVWK
jgi:hypothetical protein